MTPIEFDPSKLNGPQQAWWTAWKARAETATDDALDEFETWLARKNRKAPFQFDFDNQIWKDLKDWLLENVFFQKCGYCEREISGYYGDAEHYRPKGAVKRKLKTGGFEEPTCEILHPVSGTTLTLGHPGYFWLAYDWRNLLPSCVFCNSGQGKNERFDNEKEYVVLVKLSPAQVAAIPPAAAPRPSRKWLGFYYLAPATLDERESPFLLNPLNPAADRNPREHICFGVRGIEAAVDRSPLGLNTIEVFRLWDAKLRQRRQKAQEEFWDKYSDAMRKFKPQDPASQAEVKKLMADYRQGRYPFSAAALDYRQYVREAEEVG